MWMKEKVIGYAAFLSLCLRSDTEQEHPSPLSLKLIFPDLASVTSTFPEVQSCNSCFLKFDHLQNSSPFLVGRL